MFLCLLAVGTVGLLPSSAGAVKLGSRQIDENLTDFGAACSKPMCVFVQKSIPGTQVKAPFSGKVTKWRVVSPGTNTFQLVVLRKKDNGKYKNVGESSLGQTPAHGEYEFPANMAIKKGDYVGLKSNGVQGIFNPGAKTFEFAPALNFPNSRKPSSQGADELQFNASIKH